MNEKKTLLDRFINTGFKVGMAGVAVVAAYVGVKYVACVVDEVKDAIAARMAAKKAAEDDIDVEKEGMDA